MQLLGPMAPNLTRLITLVTVPTCQVSGESFEQAPPSTYVELSVSSSAILFVIFAQIHVLTEYDIAETR